MIQAEVVRDPIDPGKVLRTVGAPEDGAVLIFLGTVRNHAGGAPVDSLRYEAYEPMALEMLETIASEAAARFGVDRLRVVHRVGTLEVGEVSVAIAVSTPHRAEAYGASRYVIEEIKKRLPIWKEERAPTGARRWVEGYTPGPSVEEEVR